MNIIITPAFFNNIIKFIFEYITMYLIAVLKHFL